MSFIGSMLRPIKGLYTHITQGLAGNSAKTRQNVGNNATEIEDRISQTEDSQRIKQQRKRRSVKARSKRKTIFIIIKERKGTKVQEETVTGTRQGVNDDISPSGQYSSYENSAKKGKGGGEAVVRESTPLEILSRGGSGQREKTLGQLGQKGNTYDQATEDVCSERDGDGHLRFTTRDKGKTVVRRDDSEEETQAQIKALPRIPLRTKDKNSLIQQRNVALGITLKSQSLPKQALAIGEASSSKRRDFVVYTDEQEIYVTEDTYLEEANEIQAQFHHCGDREASVIDIEPLQIRDGNVERQYSRSPNNKRRVTEESIRLVTPAALTAHIPSSPPPRRLKTDEIPLHTRITKVTYNNLKLKVQSPFTSLDDDGYVYLITPDETSSSLPFTPGPNRCLIKFGRSIKPNERITTIAKKCKFKARILGIYPVPFHKKVESLILTEFKDTEKFVFLRHIKGVACSGCTDKRKHVEWFSTIKGEDGGVDDGAWKEIIEVVERWRAWAVYWGEKERMLRAEEKRRMRKAEEEERQKRMAEEKRALEEEEEYRNKIKIKSEDKLNEYTATDTQTATPSLENRVATRPRGQKGENKSRNQVEIKREDTLTRHTTIDTQTRTLTLRNRVVTWSMSPTISYPRLPHLPP